IGLSGLGGIVSPRTHGCDRIFDNRIVESSQHSRRREDNPTGLPRLQFEHTPTKRMAFYLTTELEKGGFPGRHQMSHRAVVAQAHAMHRVGTRAASLVAHQVWLETRHVSEKEIRHLHIGYNIPRLAHAAFISLACALTSLGIQVFAYRCRHIRTLR